MINKVLPGFMLVVLIGLGLVYCNHPQEKMFEEIASLQDRGAFRQAEELVQNFLQSRPDLNGATRRNLEFEIERAYSYLAQFAGQKNQHQEVIGYCGEMLSHIRTLDNSGKDP